MVVCWDVSDSLHCESTFKAFRKAVMRRNPSKGLMVHTDCGVQYASQDFRKLLQKYGCVQSMSRKGNCWDNAVAGSFFHTLKGQYINHTVFQDKMSAEYCLFKYRSVL